MLNRIEPLLEQVLRNEQADFRKHRSGEYQVPAATEHVDDAFQANKKCDALMIDPSSANDTVCMTPWPASQAI